MYLLPLFLSLLLFSLSLPAQENWANPDLAQSHLSALPPVIGETDQHATFTRELIRVEWRANDPIYLYVMLPKLVPKPPVVLYLYNFDTDTDRFRNEAFCRQLVDGGYAAVGFSAALSGQRYHDRPLKQWFVSQLPESLGTTVHDVQMIVTYLQTRGDMDTSNLGMFGEGSGASIAILAAASDPRIKVIDLLNPWGDWPAWLATSQVIPAEERPAFLLPEFLKTVRPLDPVDRLGHLTIPVRLQYLGAESSVPESVMSSFRAAAPPQTKMPPAKQAMDDYRATSGANFLDWIKVELAHGADANGAKGIRLPTTAP